MAPIDISRSCSSGSKSETVEPSSTLPEPVDDPGLEQQRLVQRGLAAAAVADQGDVANPVGGLVSHRPRTLYGRFRVAKRPRSYAVFRRRAQAQHGLRVKLGDAGLGHAEHLADLAQGEVLEVVEGDRRASRARAGPGSRSWRRSLTSLVSSAACGSGALSSSIVSSSETRSPEASGVIHSSSRARIEELEICSSASWSSSSLDLQLLGELGVGRRPAELVLELRVRLLDLAGARAHRARHPVERAQLVDDRAADALHGEGLEADLAARLEAIHRLDQADHPVGDQVGLLDVRGQPRAGAAGDELDQGRVGDDEPLAGALVALLLVAAPELLGARTPSPLLPRPLTPPFCRPFPQARGWLRAYWLRSHDGSTRV